MGCQAADNRSGKRVERYAISNLSALNSCGERAVARFDRALASRRSSAGSKVTTPWSFALLVRAAEEGARRLSRVDDRWGARSPALAVKRCKAC
jgi:hypothetical protein